MPPIYSVRQTWHTGSIGIPSTSVVSSLIRVRTVPSPTFFMLNGKAVLSFASHARGAQFYVGSYTDQRFTPERHKRLAFAESRRTGAYCEGQTLLDDRGRRILFGRFSEARFKYALVASGWAGICALPMVLSLSEDSELLLDPVPELEVLRSDHLSLRDVQVPAGGDVRLDISGDSLEMRTVLEWDDAEEIGLKVRQLAGWRRRDAGALQY